MWIPWNPGKIFVILFLIYAHVDLQEGVRRFCSFLSYAHVDLTNSIVHFGFCEYSDF